MGDIKGTLLNLTKNVSKTSGDLIKSTKLSVNLASEEELLKGVYIDIGKKVHEIYQYGGSLGPFFDEKYHEIEAHEMKIKDIKDQIHAVKGTRACPKCGKAVERNAEFCSKCGTNMGIGGSPAVASEKPLPMPEPPLGPSVNPPPVPGLPPVPGETPPVPIPPPLPDSPPVPVPPPNEQKACPFCGDVNEPNAKFCLSCGRII